ncbi:MAG TPA: hypothetical protein VFU05_12480 [Cyclobacteriaceae bacterium]|nr:hypothetical protein [Cyclobacteriaceae bacterium]
MGDGIERIQEKLYTFKRKYYLNLLVRGLLLTLSILFFYFLIAALLEYAIWFGPWMRFIIFLSFLITAAYCVYRFLRNPLSFWISKKGINDEQSARLIGDSIPTIKDRLVNIIQLSGTRDSGLAYASIRQKSKEFEPVPFESAVQLEQNRKYLKYLAIPVGIILVLMVLNQGIITQSTNRIVNFNQEFSPQAPFEFKIQNQSLTGFFYEDFTLTVALEGSAIPDAAYLVMGSQNLKMENFGNGTFQYVFEKIQQTKNFQIQAAGYYSSGYEILVVNRPELTAFTIDLQYPKYLQRKNEQLKNAGNLEIPEGTVITWKLNTSNANEASIMFASDSAGNDLQSIDNQVFTFKKAFKNPDQYEVFLNNETSQNKERIAYAIDVIKDQFPQLTVTNFKDSVLYKRIILGGVTSDDYGITQLNLEFHVKDDQQKIITKKSVSIPVNQNQAQQSFFYNWSLDTFNLKPGQQLEYFLQVWDNDGVNGRKSTRSANYTFFIPDKDQLVTDISRSQSQTENKIQESVTKAQELKDQIEDVNQKLKGKQSLDWQDKKKLENILDQKKSLDQMIEQLKEQNKLLEQKKDAFTEQDERIREKAEQIKKLMDELLDEETKKLLEELERLLKENANTQDIQKLMDKLNQNSDNVEKELERTLELFKQLQFDYKLDQAIQEIKDQKDQQQSLMEKTQELEKATDTKSKESKENKDQEGSEKNQEKAQELAKEQKELNEDFKKFEEKVEELQKLGEELNQEEGLPENEQTEEIDQAQQESEEKLNQNSPSKSKGAQQKAVQKMQKMQQQMEGMQSSMSMETDMQNIESLRQIIHGLIKISFDQENLIKSFRELEQNDPRFNGLAQQQLKLKDDVKVLEDSLLALSKRDAMMGSFVTREITELNTRIDKAVEANRDRRRQQAQTEMQFSMTSINNLALMLDSHYDMLMQMMANARPSMKKGKQKGKEKSLSEMQQQLNERIEQLKGSGKSGRQMSEELAEMAAEQERIRRALQEMEEKMKQNGGKLPGDIPGKMEETETELVNKQLTDQLIQRQREILTRLLESEKSMREQNLDEERKGEAAKDYEKEIPAAVEEYLRLKEKEVELLKTVPPKLYPYYKKEVGEYFKRIKN